MRKRHVTSLLHLSCFKLETFSWQIQPHKTHAEKLSSELIRRFHMTVHIFIWWYFNWVPTSLLWTWVASSAMSRQVVQLQPESKVQAAGQWSTGLCECYKDVGDCKCPNTNHAVFSMMKLTVYLIVSMQNNAFPEMSDCWTSTINCHCFVYYELIYTVRVRVCVQAALPCAASQYLPVRWPVQWVRVPVCLCWTVSVVYHRPLSPWGLLSGNDTAYW